MKIDLPLDLVRVVFKMPNGETVIFDNQVTVPAPGEYVSVMVGGIPVPVEGFVSQRVWTYENGLVAAKIVLETERGSK